MFKKIVYCAYILTVFIYDYIPVDNDPVFITYKDTIRVFTPVKDVVSKFLRGT